PRGYPLTSNDVGTVGLPLELYTFTVLPLPKPRRGMTPTYRFPLNWLTPTLIGNSNSSGFPAGIVDSRVPDGLNCLTPASRSATNRSRKLGLAGRLSPPIAVGKPVGIPNSWGSPLDQVVMPSILPLFPKLETSWPEELNFATYPAGPNPPWFVSS